MEAVNVTFEVAAVLGTVTTLGAVTILKRRHKKAKREEFRAALLSAIEKKEVKAIDELFEAEKSLFAEERKRTEFGSADDSPVHRAVRAGSVASLQFLLVRGFSPNSASSTKLKNPPRNRSWTQVILMQRPEEKYSAMRETALLFAVRTEKLKCARTLIAHGADYTEVGCFVEGVDLRRESAFSYAVKRGKKYRSLVRRMKCKMEIIDEKSDLDEAEEASSNTVTLSDETAAGQSWPLPRTHQDSICPKKPKVMSHHEELFKYSTIGFAELYCNVQVRYIESEPKNEETRHNGGPSSSQSERCDDGPILSPQYVPVERPPTELESFKWSMHMLRSFLLHIKSNSDEKGRSVDLLLWLKNSLPLHHEMGTASYDLVKIHHNTVKSHLGVVIRVIRNRVEELTFLKPSRLSRRCDGDELRDVDKACFEACVTFAQDNFTYLKDDQNLMLVLDVISEMACTKIGGPLMADAQWEEALAVAEAAEVAQAATPQPQQEEWQMVKKKKRWADKEKGKQKSKGVTQEQNVRRCRNRIMTLEEYNVREMLNKARKSESEKSNTSGVETASTTSAWSQRFQEAKAPETSFWPPNANESGDDKENNIGLDDAEYPGIK